MVAPTKPSTPLEWRIVFWVFAGLMLIAGIVGIVISSIDLAGKLDPDELWLLRKCSVLLQILGIAVAYLLWKSARSVE